MSHVMTRPPPSGSARPATSVGRVVKALLAGALAGGVLTSGVVLAMALIQYPPLLSLQFAALALPLATVVWLLDLVVVGGPIWWLLRGSNTRPTRLAARTGAILTPVVAVGAPTILTFGHGSLDWTLPIQVATFAILGAVVGWLTARVAYGRQGAAR